MIYSILYKINNYLYNLLDLILNFVNENNSYVFERKAGKENA